MKWPFSSSEPTAVSAIERHKALTIERIKAFDKLLNRKAVTVFPYHQFTQKTEAIDLIDVFAYEIEVEQSKAFVLLTSGMSDLPLQGKEKDDFGRFELVQYLRNYSEAHARRLYEMAWLPKFDGFCLHKGDTIEWPEPVMVDSPYKNSLFLEPLPKAHQNFRFKVDKDLSSLLWLVPLSDKELAYKRVEGLNALLDKMQEQRFPWILDESVRESLV